MQVGIAALAGPHPRYGRRRELNAVLSADLPRKSKPMPCQVRDQAFEKARGDAPWCCELG
jgi:hypothetical protein